MSTITHTIEPQVSAPVQEMPAGNQVALHDAHASANEEQITRVMFLIILAASVLFIAATLFVTHM